MEYAIELAKKGIYTTSPNPSVGCIITEGNKILSEGYHLKSGSDHAEVIALKNLKNKVNNETCMYITLEPCCHTGKTGPCTDTIIKSGIKNIFISMLDPNPLVKGKGVKKLRSNGISVNIGLCKDLSEKINRGFISRVTKKIPYVTAKQAISMDYKITNPKSKWISSAQSRKDVQYFRAKSCAILVSSKTIIKDNSKLKIKLKKSDLNNNEKIIHPIRIVLDTNLSLNINKYNIFEGKEKKIIFNSISTSYNENKNIDFIKIRKDKNGLRLKNIFNILAIKYEINNLYIEPGSKLLNTLVSYNLIDELVFYKSPEIIGKLGLSTLVINSKPSKNISIVTESITKISNDVRIIYKFLRK